MLNIDSLLLEAFVNQNRDYFTGARVQKIQQPTRREIILQLRNNNESKKLYININPSFHHVCFMDKQNEIRRNIEIPQQPPMFCMLLRKHMEGAKILKINKPEFERIIELTFENYNEIGERIEECLAIELMGKHSNIVLYNTDNNIIIGCAHNIGEEKSKERELAGGLPYIYPPKQNKKNLLKTKFEKFVSTLQKQADTVKKSVAGGFFSLSQAVVEELCKENKINPDKNIAYLSEQDFQILFIKLHEFLENENRIYSTDKNYTVFSCIKKLDIEYSDINKLIDDYFSYNIEKNIVEGLKISLKTKINKELKKLKNTRQNQQKQIDKKDKALLYMTKGNLLTANAYAIKQGEKSVALMDYETNKMIEIALDENLTPIENAKRYFDLYTKNKKAAGVAQEMIQKTIEETNYYEQLLYDIEICSSITELKEIYSEFEPEKSAQNKNKKTKEGIINIEKEEIDGFVIYIGKNNKQNDYLYSKISSPNDMWFHVLNTPGSHIIVKAPNSSAKISDELILKIAKLAKKYSTAKNSSKVSVVYTLRKYIKRPNNTKSGFVVYKNETEIVVD